MKIKHPPNYYPHRTNRLIHLLNIYIGKSHIKMKPIMKTIQQRLINNKPISFRQLEVIIPYLQNDLRDTDHKSYPKQQIIELFSVCLYDHHHTTDEDYLFEYYPHIYDELYETKTPSTLEKFMV